MSFDAKLRLTSACNGQPCSERLPISQSQRIAPRTRCNSSQEFGYGSRHEVRSENRISSVQFWSLIMAATESTMLPLGTPAPTFRLPDFADKLVAFEDFSD